MQSESGIGGPAGTVTFLFTDIEGSTRLLQRTGAAYPTILEQHVLLLREAIERHGGHVVDRAGDGLFVVFGRATGAVLAAIEAQRALLDHAWPEGVSVRVRMGVHTGEAVRSGSSYVGLDVHRTARMSAVAHGTQIVVSDVTRQLVMDELPAGVDLLDLGEHRLKDLPRPERLHQVLADGLPSAHPPLRSAGGLPANLPARPRRLIGRDTELESLQALLRREDVRLLTLTGPGGTGKTSLAVELAARSLADFPDGIAYVPLAAINEPPLVPVAIAQTLGVSPAATQDVNDALIEHLRGRRMLIVLDNFEHIMDAALYVSNFAAACARITFLVTSRVALNLSIEREFPVSTLRTPDPRVAASVTALGAYPAVELFAQRAAAVMPGFGLDEDSAEAVAAICHRLDGLPLAIELAAARIKILPPRALLARLDRRLELLSGGARDMPARHRTLRHAIGWSYDLLDPGEQAVFRRLAAFAGGCSLDAAEVVCAAAGDPALTALDGVAALVDKSLLRQDPGEDGEARFVMLETVREFALERLAASGEETTTRNAHADFFIRLTEKAATELAGAGQPIWLDRLEKDHDNLRAAFDWSVRSHDASRALRLGAAIGRFWIIRAFHTEGRNRLRSALGLAHSPEDEAVRARVLSTAAILAYEQSDLDEANARLEESLAYYRAAGDGRGVGETLNHMGWVAFFAGDIERATALSREALEAHEERNDPKGIALSLTNLGAVAQMRGDFEEALELNLRALDLRKQLGEARSIAYGMLNVGSVQRLLGDHDASLSNTRTALEMVRRLDDKQIVIYACIMMGEGALERGEPAAAVTHLDEAIALAREIVQPWSLGLALAYRAEAYATLGNADPALDMAREAVGHHLRGNIYVWRVITSHSLASVQRIAGESADAWQSYLRALGQAATRGMRFFVARCAAGLAALALEAGRAGEAARLAGAAEALRESTGAPAGSSRTPDGAAILQSARSVLGAAAADAAFESGRDHAFEDLRGLFDSDR